MPHALKVLLFGSFLISCGPVCFRIAAHAIDACADGFVSVRITGTGEKPVQLIADPIDAEEVFPLESLLMPLILLLCESPLTSIGSSLRVAVHTILVSLRVARAELSKWRTSKWTFDSRDQHSKKPVALIRVRGTAPQRQGV
jgi:hypothetical protein